MLQFQPVTLKDKMLISEFMAKRPPVIIEHSFNTLFAWQELFLRIGSSLKPPTKA